MDPSDLRDIQESLQGSGDAYARIVRRYQNEIAGRMWRFTRDRGVLEELVHDVFVEAYSSLRGYKGKAPFSHWLNRIATRVGFRYWKKQKKHARQATTLQDWDAVESSEPQTGDAQQAAELLHTLMAQLPPRDRLVLTLIHLEELSVAEASDRTGWSKTMVKVQAFRARKRLKALMEKMENRRLLAVLEKNP